MRLEVTRRSDLAICALGLLGSTAGRLKTAELASRLGAAPSFMAQVLTDLGRTGWVESSPGPNGGHDLLVDLAEISVIDVIEAMEGPTDTERCVVATSPCGTDGHCALHQAWTEARSVLLSHLSATTIDRLASRRMGGTELAFGTATSGDRGGKDD